MRIICDFDGTITRQDSTDLILEALAEPEWRALQAEWVGGRLSGADCMRMQVALIGGADVDVDAVLDTVELDPGFLQFVAWCEAHSYPVSIVSDGVDYFVSRILARYGLQRLSVVANRWAGEPGNRRLDQPWRRTDCTNGSGVCKCAAASSDTLDGVTTVFVGDGRSDFCISGRAAILFAKGALADHAAKQNRPYVSFDTFHDVRLALALLPAVSRA
jgi:2-hydroxy-3-keto-5-methylthiopentenyl-1-phosphate phosphatase